jgi:large subunit ribosomal protein L13
MRDDGVGVERQVFMSSRRQTTLHTDPADVARKWYVVDADGVPLGRLAAQVALVLMGKHRPEYTPHVDTGEYVIVTNAKQIELTGNKADIYARHRYSQYPGGLKVETFRQVRDRKPELLVHDAVRRMLPKNRLSRVMLKKLKIVAGAEHAFTGMNPTKLTIL